MSVAKLQTVAIKPEETSLFETQPWKSVFILSSDDDKGFLGAQKSQVSATRFTLAVRWSIVGRLIG
jgi:hypothetical protein